jgi:hypothetical protein
MIIRVWGTMLLLQFCVDGAITVLEALSWIISDSPLARAYKSGKNPGLIVWKEEALSSVKRTRVDDQVSTMGHGGIEISPSS